MKTLLSLLPLLLSSCQNFSPEVDVKKVIYDNQSEYKDEFRADHYCGYNVTTF